MKTSKSEAELGDCYQVVRSMHVAPFNRENILTILVATLIPIAPLLLTMMPVEALLNKFFSVLL